MAIQDNNNSVIASEDRVKQSAPLIPQLRFKEFDGEWEKKKLGDILSIGSGRDYKHLKDGDIPVYGTGGLMTYVDQFLYDGESVGIGRKGTIDKPVYFNEKFWTVDTLFYTHSFEKSLPKYVYCLFQKINWKLYNEASGVPSLSKSTIQKIKISIPSLKEQQKIATFLTAVDDKISQLTSKKEQLTQYKKGVMQQLFSYSLRLLKDGDLRKGKLVDFGYFYYGKGAPKTSIFPDAPTPCVRYGELYSTYDEEIKSINSYTTVNPKDLKLSKGGEVLVPRVGEDPLEFANCSFLPFPNVAIGEMISVFNTDENGLFMTYYINSTLKKELARRVEGGNVSNLYFRYVQDIDIEIPSKLEQEKIVHFLKSIDDKIEAVQVQIEQTQEFKKGLLQQLFV